MVKELLCFVDCSSWFTFPDTDTDSDSDSDCKDFKTFELSNFLSREKIEICLQTIFLPIFFFY